jgi:sulfatase maturation enzyme AslB (radical SAM superfamily)
MEEKNIICPYPWNSFTIENEHYNLCCAAKQGPATLNDYGLYDFFYNSDYMKEVRETMLSNKWHPDCSMCEEQEKNGLPSLRTRAMAVPNKEPKLTYLDVRLSNKCNLGCRMCSPSFSSLIAEERGIKSNYSWSKGALEQIKKIDNLQVLYITGGEPLLVKENYILLENLVETGASKRILLILNTNCTVFPDKFINLILKFEKVLVNLSIDGIGKVQEYIRWPSKWETIENVFHQWLNLRTDHEKVKIHLTPVIQLLNAPYIDEYLNYFSNYLDLDAIIDPIILEQPDYFDLSHAPQHVWDLIDTQQINSIKIKNIIEKKKNSRVEDQWFEHGVIFLQNQDKLRKINIEDYQPYFGFLK